MRSSVGVARADSTDAEAPDCLVGTGDVGTDAEDWLAPVYERLGSLGASETALVGEHAESPAASTTKDGVRFCDSWGSRSTPTEELSALLKQLGEYMAVEGVRKVLKGDVYRVSGRKFPRRAVEKVLRQSSKLAVSCEEEDDHIMGLPTGVRNEQTRFAKVLESLCVQICVLL